MNGHFQLSEEHEATLNALLDSPQTSTSNNCGKKSSAHVQVASKSPYTLQWKELPPETSDGREKHRPRATDDQMVEHYSELYSREKSITDVTFSNIQELPTMEEIDKVSTLEELNKAIDSLPNENITRHRQHPA
ncbi:hypothetical protein CHS0354_019085 [Potamilus streckersoni]|uniref:Uncharacterized protein n=1 Tax=Potamilus streckersoni TaxID=2493646 RepID=A0AAE0VQE6_9BIVA|nr:hypothetical protein CHS0354_019085 [Potamilus streckersoni]